MVGRPNACRYAGRMICPDQFIIGEMNEIATFVKQQRWCECERASWRTPDGTIVRYMDRLDQLWGITRGSTLHVVGFYDIDQMRRDLSHLHVCFTPTTGLELLGGGSENHTSDQRIGLRTHQKHAESRWIRVVTSRFAPGAVGEFEELAAFCHPPFQQSLHGSDERVAGDRSAGNVSCGKRALNLRAFIHEEVFEVVVEHNEITNEVLKRT